MNKGGSDGMLADDIWTELDAAIVLAYSMAMASGAIAINLFAGDLPQPAESHAGIGTVELIGMLIPTAFAVMMLGVKSATTGIRIRRLLGIKRPAAEIAKGIFAGFVASLASVLVMYLSGKVYMMLFGQEPEAQSLIDMMLASDTPRATALAVLAVTVVLGPFAEEVLYRGVVLSALMRRRGRVVSVLVSSAFFSLLHLHLPAAAALFMAGAMFAVAYIGSGSILAATAMHSAFNAANIAYAAMFSKWLP